MPRHIDPTAIYDSDEIKEILKGFAKLETLRAFGLIGSPGGGYWGGNVIDAVNNYWSHLARQRGAGIAFGNEQVDSNQSATEIHNKNPVPTGGKPKESQSERFRRLVGKDSSRERRRKNQKP